MSASFNEIAYRIFNIVKPKISDDESIDILEIKYDIENARALLLKRRKGTNIPHSAIQYIPKLEVESVNASSIYPDIPSDKVLLRTTIQVPEFLRRSSGVPMIDRISAPTLLSNNFSFVNPEYAVSSGNGMFNKEHIFAFDEDNYLYFITGRILSKSIKYINLNAVFERPSKVNTFMNENLSYSLTDDDDYPIPMDMIDEIENIVIKNKLSLEATQPIDDINDSSDTPKQIEAVR